MMRDGMRMPQGQRQPGLKDLLERLRQRRQQQLNRFDLGSSLDDIKRKLDQILQTERQGIDRRLNEAREGAQKGQVPDATLQKFEKLAERNRGELDKLPPDPAGASARCRSTTSSTPREEQFEICSPRCASR